MSNWEWEANVLFCMAGILYWEVEKAKEKENGALKIVSFCAYCFQMSG